METTATLESPVAAPHDGAHSIDVVATIRSDDFYREYIRTNRPLCMTQMMGSWPAMTK